MSVLADIGSRARNGFRRQLVKRYGRRPFTLDAHVPYISFTFDDFPQTALFEGGRILMEHGARGTYFVSMQLLNGDSPSGPIASARDLQTLLRDGHELACHTFEHLDGCRERPNTFTQSLGRNRAALESTVGARYSPVFAYPLDGPGLRVKRAVGGHFVACRGGGQTFNTGNIDLNLLKSYFLDVRDRDQLHAVQSVIDRNTAARGWLIFSTHDVAAEPSRYGCRPDFFDQVVRYATASGARVVPMMKACQELRIAA